MQSSWQPVWLRRASAVFALALLPALLAAAPVADCEESLLSCQTDHDSTDVTPLSIRRITTTVPPRSDTAGASLTLYRSLVPEQYAMPDEPLIALSFTQVSEPRDGLGSTWSRSTIALRVVSGEEVGWYPISLGTDSSDVYEPGREAGFPTYLAAMSLEETADGWQAETSVNDTTAAVFSWSPADLQAGVDNLDWLYERHPYLTLTPVFEGPTRHRLKRTHKPPAPVFDPAGGPPHSALGVDNVTEHAPPQKGDVHVTLNPDLNSLDAASPEPLPDLPFPAGTSLADLISVDQVAPGIFWQTDTTLITQSDELEDGGDGGGGGPPLPGAQGAVVAGPQAVTTGYLTRAVVLTTGSSLSFANADATTHDVMATGRGPDGEPLFESEYTNFGETSPVAGVESLPAGTYEFICSLHPQMTGQVIVQGG